MKAPTKSQWLSIGLAVVALSPLAFSAGRLPQGSTFAQFMDEGSTGIVYSTACVSTSWVQVAATDTIRRAMIYQTDPDLAAATVCLSTGPTNANACAESTPGVKISTGSAYTDFSGLNWFCRSRTGTVYLTGVWARDIGDYGSINRPR